jgi:hypothetical protein
MRRSLFGLMTVVAVAGLLTMTGCERSGTLRVVSINGGNTLRSDIADFMVYFDKVDSDWVSTYQFMPDSVQVVMQYVEIGPGLPTWTPYVAGIYKAVISYTGSSEDGIQYAPATIQLNQTVPADPSGKKTTQFYMNVVTGTFKQIAWEEFLQEPPPNGDYDIIDFVTAQVTFTGFDSVADREVKAVGKFQIEVGNLYDDLGRFGQ